MLGQRGFRGRSLLATAAFQGDKATFEAVWTTLRESLPAEQVRLKKVSTSYNPYHHWAK